MDLDETEIQPSSSGIESSKSGQRKSCWVCFGTEQDDEHQDVVWICPCQCKGTMKWVHEECLQRWIDEKLKRINSFARLIDLYDKLLSGSSPFVAVSIIVGSVYWCCASYGFVSVIQVMGYDEGLRAVERSDPLLLKIGLPIIPIALILSKMIKWEDFVLRLWRDKATKIPRPFSYLIELPPTKPRANCDQLLEDPGFAEPLSCTRMICGALLLPTVSALVGKIFFSRYSGAQWRRSLLGGLAFILVKGAIKIYLRKSQYIRYSRRTIENYGSPSWFCRRARDGIDAADGAGSTPSTGAPINPLEIRDEAPEVDGQPLGAANSEPGGGRSPPTGNSRPRAMFTVTFRI